MIERKRYLDTISQLIDSPVIKLLSGMRRSGKSVLLELTQQLLLACGISAERIMAINLESMQAADLLDYSALYGKVQTWIHGSKERHYLGVNSGNKLAWIRPEIVPSIVNPLQDSQGVVGISVGRYHGQFEAVRRIVIYIAGGFRVSCRGIATIQRAADHNFEAFTVLRGHSDAGSVPQPYLRFQDQELTEVGYAALAQVRFSKYYFISLIPKKN